MSTAPVDPVDPLARIVAAGPSASWLGRHKRLLIAGTVIAVLVIGYAFLRSARQGSTLTYRTEEATRGNLTVTVSATGTLQPTNEVEVGSEVSGTIESIYVDDNDRVKKGQVLARLDISLLGDKIVNARAALASAQAKIAETAASAREADANLARLRQVAELSGGKVPSKAELETAEATAQRAQAATASARADMEQARASLKSAETNLSKASIISPINGVVLSREIEPGQTVAASFQAPVLFTLAEDLREMELQVDVDEADVGHVKDGQKATFTVDAYSDRKYPAHIVRVGYGSQTKDGVVSYKTILKVRNEDLSLRPGMTATAEIVTAERSDVLLVPNAALRFTPPTTTTTQQSRSVVSRLMPRPPAPPASKKNGTANGKNGSQQVWVLRDGRPVAVPVTVGITDGRLTEVTGGGLEAGARAITDTVGAQQ
jgi:HlyD family secretion protein